MRTYWTAHGLAARGHDVHVITNALEVQPPYRMLMQQEDWERCEGTYNAGSVRVHWTDPVDRSQSYIPMASPFISKLSSITARVHRERHLNVILSHYLEPYGVAGYLASQMTGVPHVVRMAGSDAGRLWHHPQLEELYDHVLRSAETVIAARTVAERAILRGVEPIRIVPGGDFIVPEDVFSPNGPLLDLARLRRDAEADPDSRELVWGTFSGNRPYFGIYGKLGESKGSFALLEALYRLKLAGHDIGLVALAHGPADVEKRFRTLARRLGLSDRILQLPFLAHWRVPEFIRSCLAVCCLEQNFPINFHSPIVPREVLLCGGCLVAATEIIRKIPEYESLPHGYGCIAIPDVNDVATLTQTLASITVDPAPIGAMGKRGRRFTRAMQDKTPFPQQLESVLQGAAERRPPPSVRVASPTMAGSSQDRDRFPLTRLAAGAYGCPVSCATDGSSFDLMQARKTLKTVEMAEIKMTALPRASFAAAIRVEIAIAEAEDEAAGDNSTENSDGLFRLQIQRWALDDGAINGLFPYRNPSTRLVSFDFDVSAFHTVQTAADFPAEVPGRPSHLVVFGSSACCRPPVHIDSRTAAILRQINGNSTVADVIKQFIGTECSETAGKEQAWIENLFKLGLIWLREARPGDTKGMAGQPFFNERSASQPARRRKTQPHRILPAV